MKINGSRMLDYSWRAPDDTMTCWQKAHLYYIPMKLFHEHVPKITNAEIKNGEIAFQNCSVGSRCYKGKCVAEGRSPVARGGKGLRPKKYKKTTTQQAEEEGNDPKENTEVQENTSKKNKKRKRSNDIVPRRQSRRLMQQSEAQIVEDNGTNASLDDVSLGTITELVAL
jgi:hypothetical protein